MFRNVFCVLLFVLCSFSLVTTMKTVSNIYKRVNWNLYYHIRMQSNSISDSLKTKINIAGEKYSSKTFFFNHQLKISVLIHFKLSTCLLANLIHVHKNFKRHFEFNSFSFFVKAWNMVI